jgi:hypothetical protein
MTPHSTRVSEGEEMRFAGRTISVLMVSLSMFGGSLLYAAQPAPPTTDLSKWNSASELLDAQGNLLTKVTVRNGKIDFSRAPGQSREALLKALYASGARRVYNSILSPLTITSQGRLGVNFEGQGGFQAPRETDDGFDLANGEGSQILDATGTLLATVTTTGGKPALVFPPEKSLKTLYEEGVRSFYYKFEPIKGELKLHGVKIVKDDKGAFILEP